MPRVRLLLPCAMTAIVLGCALLAPAAHARLSRGAGAAATVPATPDSPSPSPSPTPSPSPSPRPLTMVAQSVSVDVDGFFSWALLDRATGDISGGKHITATNTTESMIKVWIVSDFLRRLAANNKQPTDDQLEMASAAIRNSDDNAAESLYRAGGTNAVVRRMINICDLTDTTYYPAWWSRTRMSAEDAVRMGDCVADGRAAGPKWTRWVLTEMTQVRGSVTDQQATTGGGRWGIIDGLPADIVKQDVSIKNGWTLIGADGLWHVNCLAIAKDWVLAVMMRYPGGKGLQYGTSVCKSVAQQLVTRR